MPSTMRTSGTIRADSGSVPPTPLRATLSGLFVPQAGMEAGDSAAKPGGGGSEDRYKQEAGAPSQATGAPAAGKGEAATVCPSPSIEAVPARAAAGAGFRLRGHNFSPRCGQLTPLRDVGIFFHQDGKTWKLAILGADRARTFDTRLRVPKDAEPGRATVSANVRSGERAQTRFVVLR